MEHERLNPILEAALLASPQPLTPVKLAELFDEGERPTLDLIAQSLHALTEACTGRGVELVQVGSGFRYQIRSEVFARITGLWTERQTRYSRALLETLSLIAYRQPITRGEIEQIRGVAVATSILRTLEEREWVRVVGHRDVPGKPALYGTTRAFLDYFQLKSLDELPPLSALRDLDSLEPELALEVIAPAPGADADADADAESDGAQTALAKSESESESVTQSSSENEPVGGTEDPDESPESDATGSDDSIDRHDSDTTAEPGPDPEASDATPPPPHDPLEPAPAGRTAPDPEHGH